MIPSFLKRNPSPTASPTQSPEKQGDPFWRIAPERYRYQSFPAKTPGSTAGEASRPEDDFSVRLIGHDASSSSIHQYPSKPSSIHRYPTAQRKPSLETCANPFHTQVLGDTTTAQRRPSQETCANPPAEEQPTYRLRLTQQALSKALGTKMALTALQSEALEDIGNLTISLAGTTEQREEALSLAVADIVAKLASVLVQSAKMSTWASNEDAASLASTKEVLKEEVHRREAADVWVPSAGTVTQIAWHFNHPPSNTSSPTAASTGRIQHPKVLDIQQGTCPHCGLKGSKERVAALGEHHNRDCVLRSMPQCIIHEPPPTTTGERQHHPPPRNEPRVSVSHNFGIVPTASIASLPPPSPPSATHIPPDHFTEVEQIEGLAEDSSPLSPPKPAAFHYPAFINGLQDSGTEQTAAVRREDAAPRYTYHTHHAEVASPSRHASVSRAAVYDYTGLRYGSEHASAVPFSVAAQTRQGHYARMGQAAPGPQAPPRPSNAQHQHPQHQHPSQIRTAGFGSDLPLQQHQPHQHAPQIRNVPFNPRRAQMY